MQVVGSSAPPTHVIDCEIEGKTGAVAAKSVWTMISAHMAAKSAGLAMAHLHRLPCQQEALAGQDLYIACGATEQSNTGKSSNETFPLREQLREQI